MIHTFISKTDHSFVGRGSRSFPCTSVDSFPLLSHRSLEQCVARRRDNRFTVREFLASARDLAFRLPVKRHVINLCKDRYHFLIGFAAALISRQISLLPNCYASEALAQLRQKYPDAYILADHDDVPSNISLYRVPNDVPSIDRRADIPLIPSGQIAAVVFTSGSSGLPQAYAKTWGSLVRGAQALETPVRHRRRWFACHGRNSAGPAYVRSGNHYYAAAAVRLGDPCRTSHSAGRYS